MRLIIIKADWTHGFGSSEKARLRPSVTPLINVLGSHNPRHRYVLLDTLSRILGLERTQVNINTALRTKYRYRRVHYTSVCQDPRALVTDFVECRNTLKGPEYDDTLTEKEIRINHSRDNHELP